MVFDKIPPLAFGTGLLKGKECCKYVIQAIENGVRIIDTAQSYGNEEDTGDAIEYCIEKGIIKREDLFVITKLNAHKPISYDIAIQSYEESLKKLKLDYVDLYLIHAPNMTPGDKWKQLNAEVWKAFEYLYMQRKVKYIGVSNFMILHLEELLKTATIKPFVNQIECHPVWQQKELRAFCKQQGIVVMGYYALLNGRSRENPVLQELEKRYHKTPAQILLKWSVQKNIIPVFQSKSQEHLLQDLDIFDFELNSADICKIETLNSHPFNASPESWYERYTFLEQAQRKVVKKYWKFFGKINLIKIKEKSDGIYKGYLLGFIPVIRIKVVGSKSHIYMLGIKVITSYSHYKTNEILPRYK